jgi:ABC-type transport system involved in cytochrome c biogenesis permease subunit
VTAAILLEVSALAALAASAALGVAEAVLGLARSAGARLEAATDAPTASVRVGAGADGWSRRLADLQYRLVQLALVLLLAALASTALLTGRAPWTNLAETAFTFAATLLAGYLFVARSTPVRGLAAPAALLAGLLVAYGLALPNDVEPLVPALQQPVLLTVHVGAAVASYGAGAVAFLAALSEISQRWGGDRLALLPSAAVSRRAANSAVIVAFPLLTAAIVLGSVWANLAWRSYWNNDPKELAAAATWLVYAAELHLAGRRDRWGAAAPWLLVLGFAGILFTWLGAGLLFIGQHGYATG